MLAAAESSPASRVLAPGCETLPSRPSMSSHDVGRRRARRHAAGGTRARFAIRTPSAIEKAPDEPDTEEDVCAEEPYDRHRTDGDGAELQRSERPAGEKRHTVRDRHNKP